MTNALGMKLAWISPGNFLMGSPASEAERDDDETQHRVTLTKGFYLYGRFANHDGKRSVASQARKCQAMRAAPASTRNVSHSTELTGSQIALTPLRVQNVSHPIE